MLVIGVLGEAVLVEGIGQGGVGRLFQGEGELGLACDFGRHAGGQQEGEAAKEKGMGVWKGFRLAQ